MLSGTVPLWSVQQIDAIKVIEFCSSVDDGLKLLFKNLDKVLKIVNRSFVFNQNFQNLMCPQFSDIDILYSSATVLLDMSANDQFIVKISELMKDNQMYEIIC